jgi:hypothetical protein
MLLPDGSSLDTGVEVSFEGEHGRTRLTIIQRGFPAPEFRDEFTDGWASILDQLGHVIAERVAGSR